MAKPIEGTYASYFNVYIHKVAEDDLTTAFKNQLPVIKQLLDSVSEEKSLYAYDTGKWTLREVLQHIIDTERIFSYRALCIARKESGALPGFDENDYSKNSNANRRTWAQLCEEFYAVRKTTEMLFESFTPEALEYAGVASNNPATVKSIGFTLIGHVNHHKQIIEERYL